MSGTTYLRGPLDVVAQFTMNLAQAAGTYDLCTVSGGDLFIWDLSIYCTVVGATWTSVTLQTNPTTNFTFLNATDGARANFTADKDITLTWPKVQKPLLRSGKKIQYTIAGSTGTGTAIVTVVGLAVGGAAVSLA